MNPPQVHLSFLKLCLSDHRPNCLGHQRGQTRIRQCLESILPNQPGASGWGNFYSHPSGSPKAPGATEQLVAIKIPIDSMELI